MNNAAASVLVFACVSVLVLGYWLVIPASYNRIQANITDATRNSTLINSVGFTDSVQNATSTWLPWVAAAITIFAVVIGVARRS